MRITVALVVGALTATPAIACPQGASCITTSIARAATAETPAPAKIVRLALTEDRAPSSPLGRSLATYTPEDPDELEVPWIWQVIETEVKGRLPRVEQDNTFSMVVSPVVVRSPSDTVPGVGLSGDF